METRRLVSLYKGRSDPDKYYIDFGYYDEGGNWTGRTESCEISEDELYNAIKPYLKTEYHNTPRTQVAPS